MDRLQRKVISKMGGLARVRLHGNPGTTEGRALGGARSLLVQKNKKTNFKVLRKITLPNQSKNLAELVGIFMGDGHVHEYQATVVTNSITDKEHAQYISELIQKLFFVPVSITKRKNSNALVVCVSSKEFCRLLSLFGIPKGNKVTLQVKMPKWITNKMSYRKAFIRGLFDTDGSVYLDNKTHNGKNYSYLGMSFSNRSLPLISAFKEELQSLGFHPTQKTKYAVFLRRRKEILRYFSVIGSSNPKHKKKIERTFKSAYLKNGRVPKRS